MFRLWAKIRKPEWRSWEARADPSHMFAAGAGRTITDVVWRQNVRADAATNDGDFNGAILYDLKKACEMVQHIRLWNEGIKLRFPMVCWR